MLLLIKIYVIPFVFIIPRYVKLKKYNVSRKNINTIYDNGQYIKWETETEY